MKQFALRLCFKLVRRIGWSGVAGGFILAVGLALALSLPALERETRDSTAAMAARGLAARQHAQARPVSVTPADAARAYVDGFPALSQNAADVAQVFAAAQLRHVQLPKGEYQLKAEPGAPFVTYTATFPVHGDYDALKGFSADVLNALPHVSMDEMRLSRESAGSTTLDAVVRFTFFYRSA
jgi:hypothetical protein